MSGFYAIVKVWFPSKSRCADCHFFDGAYHRVPRCIRFGRRLKDSQSVPDWCVEKNENPRHHRGRVEKQICGKIDYTTEVESEAENENE
jgi:hypothetical protein